MKFVKRPIVINAVQFFGANFREIKEFVGKDAEVIDENLFITTLEGNMKVSATDWVIQGVNGEFYPCKSDIFEQTYDKTGA